MTQRLPNSLQKSGIHWCWVGAVTNNQVTIKAKIRKDIINQSILIKYAPQDSLDSLQTVPATSLVEQIATFNLNNLEEDQKYYYEIRAGATLSRKSWRLPNI